MIEDINKYRQHISTTTAAFGFYVLTFCFLKIALDIYCVYNNKSMLSTNLLTLAFSLIFAIFMYSRNLDATKNDLICGNVDHSIAAVSTLVPFVIIYGLTVTCLHIFPGWLRCFSNTFGTWFVNLFLSLNETMLDWIQLHAGSRPDDNGADLNAIAHMIKHSPETLFNELDGDYTTSGNVIVWQSFDDINKQLKSKIKKQNSSLIVSGEGEGEEKVAEGPDQKNGQTDSIKQTLLLYVCIKNAIGLCIWLYGIGLITLQVGFNAMLAQDCSSFKRSHTDVQEYIRERLKE